MDEGGFILDYKAKPGSALTDTDRLLRQVEKIIRETPEVTSYSRRTGVQLGGGLTEADEGDFFIRLSSGHRRNIEEVMSEIRSKVEHQVPGLEIETAQLMEDLIGDLTAVPQPIEVKLFGDDPQQLETAAGKVVEALPKIEGVVEVASGLRVAGDAIIIHVDRAAASLAGLDPDQVSKQVETQVGGTLATQVLRGEQTIDVRVRLPQELRQRANALQSLTIRSADGRAVPLSSIAQISIQAGQRQITREDLAPFIPVTARLEGKDLGTGMAEVQAAVTRAPPASVNSRRLWRPLSAAKAVVPRSHHGLHRGASPFRLPADPALRNMGLYRRSDFDSAVVDRCGVHGALADRDRARHIGTDGADDGHRHAHRAGDLLLGRTGGRRGGHGGYAA